MNVSNLSATARVGRVQASMLDSLVEEPWHVYGPDSASGLPALVEAADPMRFTALRIPSGPDGELSGRVAITGTVTGVLPGVHFVVGIQACDGPRCESRVTRSAIVRGGVAAGLTAALYAARADLVPLLIEGPMPDGAPGPYDRYGERPRLPPGAERRGTARPGHGGARHER